MTSALTTIALIVLGAAICSSFADGRVLLQGPSSQPLFAPLSDPSANATSSKTYILRPFSEVRSCVPFTVLIATPTNASADGNGTLVIEADKDVIYNIDGALSNGVLALSVSPGFETNNRIKCTITPGSSTSLSGVHNSGTGNLIVGPGFRAKNFTIASTAIGDTFVFGLTTSTANVFSMGSSTVLLNGNVSNGGSLEAGDKSKVYLTGAIGGTLEVSLEDSSSTFVQGLPGTTIQGDVDPSAKLRYTAGTCRLQSGPCTRWQADGAPSFTPSWSCGLQVEGESTCTSDEAISSPLIPEVLSLAETATGISVVRVRCLDPSPLNIF